jgi:pimeloyl-ACP methyl ester carboxylesterase
MIDLLATRATSARAAASIADVPHAERMAFLEEWTRAYATAQREPFRQPRRISPTWRDAGSFANRRVVDLSWSSDYEPALPDLADRYLCMAHNHVAAARLFLSSRPRPIAVLLHGYMMGDYRLEQRIWPVQWLSDLGLDVALFVLPFHGLRCDPAHRGPPPFPGFDPRLTNEGFFQAIADLRDFLEWLRLQGHSKVGLMGMSLGAYTAALCCTVDPNIDFAVPVIPLACLADFAREQGHLGGNVEQIAAQHTALERFHEIVSPLARKPQLSPDRILVIAGKYDRITPVSHARRLARHFNAQLFTWPGGHVLQIGRAAGFNRVAERLRKLGIV